jgi:hypothetical protein
MFLKHRYIVPKANIIEITSKIFDLIKNPRFFTRPLIILLSILSELAKKEYFLGNTNSYSFKLLKEKEIYKEKEIT